MGPYTGRNEPCCPERTLQEPEGDAEQSYLIQLIVLALLFAARAAAAVAAKLPATPR